MKQILCDGCGVPLNAANWWHDAEICNQCGINVPLNMVPESQLEERSIDWQLKNISQLFEPKK